MCSVAFLLYIPFIFLGYGADSDSFLVLETGRGFLKTGQYLPSRNPGFIVYEAVTLLLDQLGGSLLCNLGTLAMALLCVASFIYICHRFEIQNRRLLATILILHPVFWSQAACTMDYVWALGFLLGGTALLFKEMHKTAAVLFALAIGTRCTSVLTVIPVLAYFYYVNKSTRIKFIVCGLITVAIATVFYLPSFALAGWTLKFMKPGYIHPEAWTPFLKLVKWGYRNIYFWGLPTIFFLLLMAWYACGFLRNANNRSRWFPILALCVGVILPCEAMFMVAPAEIPYLLPMLPFALMAAGILLEQKTQLLVALTALLVFYSIVNFNIAQPNVKQAATGAHFGLWMEPGYMIKEVQDRMTMTRAVEANHGKVPQSDQ